MSTTYNLDHATAIFTKRSWRIKHHIGNTVVLETGYPDDAAPSTFWWAILSALFFGILGGFVGAIIVSLGYKPRQVTLTADEDAITIAAKEQRFTAATLKDVQTFADSLPVEGTTFTKEKMLQSAIFVGLISSACWWLMLI